MPAWGDFAQEFARVVLHLAGGQRGESRGIDAADHHLVAGEFQAAREVEVAGRFARHVDAPVLMTVADFGPRGRAGDRSRDSDTPCPPRG